MTNTFTYASGPLGNYYHANTNLVDRGSRVSGAAALYHHTTVTNQIKEAASQVDIGFHYMAMQGFLASAGFSPTHGLNGWSYRFCLVGHDLDPGWLGWLPSYLGPLQSGEYYLGGLPDDTYCWVGGSWQHPGNTRGPWLLPMV